MAFDDPQIDGNSISGLELRRPTAALLMGDGTAGGARSGVRPGSPGLVVSLAGSTINVTAGVAAISYSGQGVYLVYGAAGSPGTLAAADATFDRIDLVYLRVWDNTVDSSGLAKADVVYLTGTPAASPAAPTPSGTQIYMPLATISVPHVGGGSPSVTDTRPVTVGPGGIGVGTGIPGVHAGQYRDTGGATGTLQHYNGSSWEDILRVAGQLVLGGSASSAALAVQLAASGTTAQTHRVVGDSQNRYSVDAAGKLQWGPGGSTAQDTNFYRSAAGVLTTDGALVVGGNLTVSGVGSVVTKYKTAQTSRASTTTLVSDPDITFTVVSGGVYEVTGLIVYNGGSGSDDLKIGWTAPASSTFAWGAIAQPSTATGTIGSVVTDAQTIASSSFSLGTIANANGMLGHVRGLLTAGGSGTFALQWSQLTSSATATLLLPGTHVTVRRVA